MERRNIAAILFLAFGVIGVYSRSQFVDDSGDSTIARAWYQLGPELKSFYENPNRSFVSLAPETKELAKQFNDIVRELMKNDPNISYETAALRTRNANPYLYKQIVDLNGFSSASFLRLYGESNSSRDLGSVARAWYQLGPELKSFYENPNRSIASLAPEIKELAKQFNDIVRELMKNDPNISYETAALRTRNANLDLYKQILNANGFHGSGFLPGSEPNKKNN
ncbi:uncharacterized protein [Venturia canescens]|uniref:uncharacterized protein n=1 Tax=Venturia canescens TaxID=32260 RepID=UPI001C9D246D|nr:uncharacterized protein LOC122416377 [Venturia canescens]XP_043285208.1 uncharacterized protein LOC122416377 [Venturia canescens]XP_043285209.1 uncharacterized protein LOC122416377 [Venturia canescens]